jgi:DNA-binding PadR family transcriptional regulator
MATDVVQFAILGLISTRAEGVHGYQLKTEFDALYGDLWSLNYGQLYRTLDRLERAGLVQYIEEVQSGRPPRKIYRITASGRQDLDDWLLLPPTDKPRPLHDELSVKLLFLLTETRRKETLGLIRSQRATYLHYLARLTERRSLLDERGEDKAVTNLLLLQADMRVRADLAWLDLVENKLLQPGEGEGRRATPDQRLLTSSGRGTKVAARRVPMAQWAIKGRYMEACSCDFLCPCIPRNATTPATHDFCKVALTFAIESGRYGDVPLDGVRFTVFFQSKAIMTQGGWIGGVIVDTAASDAQAEAVVAIASGSAGGPFGVFAPMLADFRGVERHPIAFVQEGKTVSVRIDGLLDQSVVGVDSVAVPGECVVIDNTFHPANKRLNLATALRNLISAFGIEWTGEPNRTNGHFAPFDWQGAAT